MHTSPRPRTAWLTLVAYLCGAGIGVLSLIQTHPLGWGWDETYVVLRALFVVACLTAAVALPVKNLRHGTGKSSRTGQTSP
jgi:sugar phosphate permease